MEKNQVGLAPPPPPSAGRPLLRSASDTSGIILGRYRLGRFLGQGSFAKVHEAHSLADGSTVAVKIIDKKSRAFADCAAMEPLIVGEIEAMRRLKHHPNILRIVEVMATRTKIYLVVELAGGGELLRKIAKRPNFLLKESEAKRYFRQLVSALRFCHRNGVAHRDVKPQNLLLDGAGNLKVSDFGLSAIPERIRPDGMLHTACGTPAFTAPEILSPRRGAAGYDGAKADAWSCGVVLHLLLAGKLPFNDENLAAMYRKIKNREIEYPSRISGSARKIIHRLLDPNPKTRLSVEGLSETAWFKKIEESYNYETLSPPENNNHYYHFDIDVKEGKRNDKMNAFEIISLSSGLDLSGLFEPGMRRREERFLAAEMGAEAAVERVRDVAERLGFRLGNDKGGRRLGLVKGGVVVVVEAAEIFHSLVLGEVKVVRGGDGDWEELKNGVLGEAGFTWLNDVV